jgi:FkbM family methyltransferase
MTEFQAYKVFLPPNAIVYDIGAHIGENTWSFLHLGAKQIYAFEPSIRNLTKLQASVGHLDNVRIFDLALNDKEYKCQTRFKDCATHHIALEDDVEQPIEYAILENVMIANSLLHPTFIKVDIEGMESIVFKTFEFLFNKIRPIFHLEVHVAPKNTTIQNYTDNPHWKYPDEGGYDFNKLKDFNYLMLDEHGQEVVGDYNPPPLTHGFFVLVPKEKVGKES